MDTNTALFLNSNSPLMSTYSKLIAIEIALRAQDPIFTHDIPAKLNNFGMQNPSRHSIYATHSSQISSILSSIPINQKPKKGTPKAPWTEYIGLMPPSSYPYIRYVRLRPDYPLSSIDITTLQILNNKLDLVILDLKTDGVSI